MFNNINKEYEQLLIYTLDILRGENESVISNNIISNVFTMLTNYVSCLTRDCSLYMASVENTKCFPNHTVVKMKSNNA